MKVDPVGETNQCYAFEVNRTAFVQAFVTEAHLPGDCCRILANQVIQIGELDIRIISIKGLEVVF